MTTTMSKAMETARLALIAAGLNVTIKPHQGDAKKAQAIRVSGCWPEMAADALQVIEAAIPGSTKVQDAGFAAVWLPRN